ncbi:MAG: hypothetical protein IPP63_10140 [Chloracidobacterium sp.]|nr:hypothetical protein [Chloracidobacterium sp.]
MGLGAGSWKLDSLDADGVGLRNVRERLASYYGSDAKLVFTRNDGAGTTVEIELPLKGRSSKEQEN